MHCSREFKVFFTEDVEKMVDEMFEAGVSDDKEIITRENTLADKMYCCPYCGKRSQQSLMFYGRTMGVSKFTDQVCL